MRYRDVGRNIKKARTHAGYSQADLAMRVGISRNTLMAYEHGYAGQASLKHLRAIARALRVPMCDLLGDRREVKADGEGEKGGTEGQNEEEVGG